MGRKKLLYKEVKKYFKEHDCELLETEYINNYTLMRYKCDCGNPDCKITFHDFKSGRRCMKCSIKRRADKKRLSFEEVKQYFEDHDCKLLETEYINIDTPMRYICDCGNKKCKITFYNFKKGQRCTECAGNKKYTLEEVKQYFKDHDCELLATEYINSKTPMEYICDCGNDECKICFNNFQQGQRCRKCYLKRNSGKNNHFYNPNLTDEEREKGRICPGIGKWKKDIRERDNYISQCCFQKEGKLIAHHIEGYSNNKELRTVVSNGFLFCEKHHIEFHKIYGYDCNRKQLEEYLSKKLM